MLYRGLKGVISIRAGVRVAVRGIRGREGTSPSPYSYCIALALALILILVLALALL